MLGLNLSNDNLKKFGIAMGWMVLLVMVLLILLKRKYSILPASLLSALFFLAAYLYPVSLRMFYILWMTIAFALSWVNTRIMLLIIFYSIFTPIGLAMKLFRVDPLDRKIDRERESYWMKKVKHFGYERQF